MFGISLGATRVVQQHLRCVVLRIDAEADEPHVLPARRAPELTLDRAERGDNVRADFATARERELRDPHQAVELSGAKTGAILIGQRE